MWRIQLDLEELYRREVTTADGRTHLVPCAGPVAIKFENRACFPTSTNSPAAG